jgi:hypothetical protein
MKKVEKYMLQSFGIYFIFVTLIHYNEYRNRKV